MRQYIHAIIAVARRNHLCERGLAKEVHRRLEEVDEVILELRERVLNVQGVEVLVQRLAARNVQELRFWMIKGYISLGTSSNPCEAAERTS